MVEDGEDNFGASCVTVVEVAEVGCGEGGVQVPPKACSWPGKTAGWEGPEGKPGGGCADGDVCEGCGAGEGGVNGEAAEPPVWPEGWGQMDCAAGAW